MSADNPPAVSTEHPAGRGEREQRIAATFVELADTLVAGFDLIDFLHTLAALRTAHGHPGQHLQA